MLRFLVLARSCISQFFLPGGKISASVAIPVLKGTIKTVAKAKIKCII